MSEMSHSSSGTERENVAELLGDLHDNIVYSVEDGVVWVSGMNAHCVHTAETIAKELVRHDIPCSLVYDDGIHASKFGGVEFRYGENA